jgi:phospholipid/cholesterol/gamma-HCH transport system substrate-binding protein
MEATKDKKIKMGMFVAAGLSFVLLSILILGGDKLVLARKAYLSVTFAQVQGLAEGSLVSLSGLPIGNVSKISLNNDGQVLVQFKVQAEYLSQISKDSTVEIRTQGALGDKYLFISSGPASVKAQNGDQLQAVKSSDLISTIMERGDEAKKVFEIINEAHVLLKSLNEDSSLKSAFKNLSEASYSFKTTINDVQALVKTMKTENTEKKVTDSLTHLNSILNKIDKGEGTLGALINERELHDSLKNYIGITDRKQGLKQLIRSSIEKSESPQK